MILVIGASFSAISIFGKFLKYVVPFIQIQFSKIKGVFAKKIKMTDSAEHFKCLPNANE